MITTGGVNFEVTGEGAGTIIFVHGFSCALEDWKAQIAELSPTFRCVALDLPGHGSSAMPSEPTLAALGAAVNEVRREIGGGRCVLVGHSLGAKVIREAYGQRREDVAGLVLIDGAFYDGDRETMRARATAAIDGAGFNAFQESHFATMFTENSDPAFRNRVVARATRLDPAYGRALYLEAVTWDPARGRETLHTLTVPTLVLQSTHIGADLKRHPVLPGMTTSFMQLVTELVPQSEAIAVPGVGHFTMNEAADAVNRAIRAFASRVLPA